MRRAGAWQQGDSHALLLHANDAAASGGVIMRVPQARHAD